MLQKESMAHMADRTGQQLGNYRLLHLLGRGGFADVYLGEHVHLNTLAAIKVFDTYLSSEGRDQFVTFLWLETRGFYVVADVGPVRPESC